MRHFLPPIIKIITCERNFQVQTDFEFFYDLYQIEVFIYRMQLVIVYNEENLHDAKNYNLQLNQNQPDIAKVFLLSGGMTDLYYNYNCFYKLQQVLLAEISLGNL